MKSLIGKTDLKTASMPSSRRSSGADFALQELFVGGALNLDQVRHLHGFGDVAERLPDPLLAGERLRHHGSLGARGRASARGQSSSCVHPRIGRWPKLAWPLPDAGNAELNGPGRPFALVGGRRTAPRGGMRNAPLRRARVQNRVVSEFERKAYLGARRGYEKGSRVAETRAACELLHATDKWLIPLASSPSQPRWAPASTKRPDVVQARAIQTDVGRRACR